ncbi:MAG TPA: inositol monophosphatase family protein [Nitriliruptorales bacterium]
MSGDDRLRSQLLAFCHELADEADRLTMAAFGGRVEASAKADGSPVTEVDLAVERRLRDRIAGAWPGHAIVGEELGGSAVEAEFTWYLDPIDGTRNFARGIPAFATLVCVEQGAEPAVAVASAPGLGTRWDGQAGVGAHRDGQPIRVAHTSALSESSVSFGGLSWFEPYGGMDLVGRVTAATARQRGFGDFWHHCLVAEGALDVALEADVSAWDLAAVRCIVTAAGGRFTDFTGVERIDGGTAISAAPGILDELLTLVHG